MDSFFTWNALLTYSGATLATTLITQLLKDLPFIKKLRARVLSYITALVLMLLAMLFEGSLTWESAAVSPINAAVVALAANGTFDAVNGIKKNKLKPNAKESGDDDRAA